MLVLPYVLGISATGILTVIYADMWLDKYKLHKIQDLYAMNSTGILVTGEEKNIALLSLGSCPSPVAIAIGVGGKGNSEAVEVGMSPTPQISLRGHTSK